MEGDDTVSTLPVDVDLELREQDLSARMSPTRPSAPPTRPSALPIRPSASPIRPSTTPSSGASRPGEQAWREPLAAAASQLPKAEVVECLFKAFSERDLLRTLALMHPEIVFEPMTAAVTRAGEPYRGHEGMRRYVEDVEAHWDELHVHPVQVRAAGRAVVVLGMVSGRGAAGSFEDAPTTWVLKFRDGLVSHIQIFSDARHVREALVGEDA
jgi:ketosteroid isomerase-like protein